MQVSCLFKKNTMSSLKMYQIKLYSFWGTTSIFAGPLTFRYLLTAVVPGARLYPKKKPMYCITLKKL